MIDLNLFDTVPYISLLGKLLLHGTVLALLTWVLSSTVLRNLKPSLQALLWTVVLLKFLLPPVFPGQFALSGLLAQWTESTPAAVNPEAFSVDTAGAWPAALPATGPGWMDWASATLCVIYLLFFLVVAARTVRSSLSTFRSLSSLPVAPAQISEQVTALGRSIGLRQAPRVLISERAASPYVIGVMRPVLVLPPTLFSEFDEAARGALILHELAHLRRGDLLVRSLQNLARLLFFFWPPVWWVCRRIEHYSEMACDQWAVKVSRIRPDHYASSLLSVARRVSCSPATPLSQLTLARKGHSLEERFEMILKGNSNLMTKFSFWAVAALLLWVPFALAGGEKSQEPQSEKTESKTFEIKIAPAGEGVWVSQDGTKRHVVRAELKDVDTDGDGEISQQEMDAFIAQFKGAETGEEGAQMIFLSAEKGPQDVLVLRSEDDGPLHEALAADMLREHPEADLDGDGTLSSEELKHFLHERHSLDWTSEVDGGKARILISADPEASTEEGRMKLADKFPELDTDGDGILNDYEMQQLQERHASHKVMVRVAEGDSPEAQQGSIHISTPQDGEVHYEFRGHLSEIKELADTDGDGVLSEGELKAFAEQHREMNPDGPQVFFMKKLKEDYAPADLNKDGTVTAAEAKEFGERSAEQRRAQFLAKFPEADLNGDGVLDQAEAEALAKKLQDQGKRPPQ